MVFANQLENKSLMDLVLKFPEDKNVWNSVKHMLAAAETAKAMDEQMLKLGYETNPYSDIFGHIADAVYHLIRENKQNFEDSVTYVAMNTESLSKEEKLILLFRQYEQNKKEPAR